MDTEIETHKARLQADNSKEIERLKAQLQLAASEHEIRFTRLHEKVADVVAETYLRLFNARNAVALYISVLEIPSMGSKEERRKAVQNALDAFREYFYPRRLYISKELCDRITAFDNKAQDLAQRFMYGVEKADDRGADDTQVWVEVNSQFQSEAGPLFERLEQEFRNLLGVPSGSGI